MATLSPCRRFFGLFDMNSVYSRQGIPASSTWPSEHSDSTHPMHPHLPLIRCFLVQAVALTRDFAVQVSLFP